MGKKEISFGFRIFLIAVELIIMTSILGGAWLIDKLLIAPPLIVAFRIVRVKIEKKYAIFHMATIFSCMIVSVLVSLIGLYVSLPISVSLISNIVIGVGFALISLYAQDIIDLKIKHIEITRELEALKNCVERDESFDVDNCTQEQLIARCKELSMSDEAIELAIELFINKTKQSIVADKLCIEEKSVQQHKRRLRKKLNKNS
jgi:hypothetical protein